MATAVSNSVIVPIVDADNGTLADEYINGLLQGSSWQFSGSPRIVTYSFNVTPIQTDEFGNTIPGTGAPFSTSLIEVVNRGFAEWGNVANVTFQQITSGIHFYESNANIALSLTGRDLVDNFGALAVGIFPDPTVGDAWRTALQLSPTTYPNPEGDIFFASTFLAYTNPGGQWLDVVIHEIGHALGLKHPDDDGGNGRPTFASLGIAANDSERWTVMSGNTNVGWTVRNGGDSSPMPLDILAIQQIYGANNAYRTGDDVYVFGPNSTYYGSYRTIWDAGGLDTIDATAYNVSASGVTIDLQSGIGFAVSSRGPAFDGDFLAIAYNVTIENALGSAFDDTIAGNDANNLLDGRSGLDRLLGYAGNDTLVGGGGNDVLDGGEGLDSARYSGGATSYTILRSNQGITVSGPDGTDSLMGVERLLYGDGSSRMLKRMDRDFADDGKSDILWRNNNGNVLDWVMNGSVIVSSPFLASVSNDWKIADGAGDYNGDGKSDVLWRNDNGSVLTWLMNGAAIASNPFIAGVGSDWKIADGAGDYNGDGKSDVLWRNDDGRVLIWQMNGGTISSSALVASVDGAWKIADGSGDYDGDGKSDVLWRNDNGGVLLWLMNGSAIASNPFVAAAGLDWKIADGSGDYNGDGKSDILWRNANGNVLTWQMNGSGVATNALVAPASNDWKIADGAGDYNGDGKSDILWRNDNGTVLTWTMDGALIAGTAVLAPVGTDWQIQA